MYVYAFVSRRRYGHRRDQRRADGARHSRLAGPKAACSGWKNPSIHSPSTRRSPAAQHLYKNYMNHVVRGERSGIAEHFEKTDANHQRAVEAATKRESQIAAGRLLDVWREESPDREVPESTQAPTRKKSGGGSRSRRKSKKTLPVRCIYPDCALQYCDHPKKVMRRGRPRKAKAEMLTEPFDAKLEPDHALFLNRSYAKGLRFEHVLDVFLIGVERLKGNQPDVDLGPVLGVRPDLGVKLYQTSSFADNPRRWGRRGHALNLQLLAYYATAP